MAKPKANVLVSVIERLRREVERSYVVRASLEGRTRAQQISHLKARLSVEPAERTMIDSACQHWIAHGIWPALTAEQAVLVCDRFEHSVDFAAWLDYSGFRFAKTERELLTFLLIDNWQHYGIHRMRSRLVKLLTAN